MKTVQLRRIKEVFLRTLYLPPESREACAREECSDDPAVLADVLRLLRAQAKVRSVLAGAAPGSDDAPGDIPPDGAVSAPADADAPRTGDVVLGRYELRDVLGAGAFGTVHRAFDRVARSLVAVKCVALTTRRIREWHVREIASLRRARVPGVVELLATGREGRWGVVVMTLVEGHPFPGQGVLPGDGPSILQRTTSLLEAVGYLHAAGVYHRDLKPSNVLVSPAGLVTLVDFGIALDETDAARWVPEATIAGTFDYMAPERLRGEHATAQSELYAVGVIAIEALLGELPLHGRMCAPGSSESVYARLDLEASLGRIVPEGVAKLLASLIAHDPRERPADVRTVLDALDDALGSRRAIELPRLGGDAPVRAVLEAAEDGRSLDVVGPPGSGKSRTLDDAEHALRAAGFLVQRVQPAPPGDGSLARLDAESLEPGVSRDALDREVCASIRRRVADGLVLLVDDHESLDAPTRALVDDLRGSGTVIRARSAADGPCIVLAPLAAADLEAVIRGPERIFHVRTEIARLLWQRTRGLPRDVARQIRSWCATGLTAWDGALVAGPKQLDRLRGLGGAPVADQIPAALSAEGLEIWNALTLVGEPVTAAALAEIVAVPRRVVTAEVANLSAAGLVRTTPDGLRTELARACPTFADVPLEARRVWSERAAAHVPPRSEARFRLLVAGGQFDPACRAALDIAAAQFDAGNLPVAVAVLDPALAVARRHLPAAVDLYADLLAALADAALGRGTRDAIDLALYHAGLAPDRNRRAVAWTSILEAAAEAVSGDSRRALAILDEAGDLPSEAHRRAAHIVATQAARMTRDVAIHRHAVAACANWARRSGHRDLRSILAAATGWLRYEQGRYQAAYLLHVRAARLTRRSRSRTTSLCNAAMAAVEAGNLDVASALAEDAQRAARRLGDAINEARAELLLRQCAYRSGRVRAPDDELIAAAEHLDRGATRGAIHLTEAAVAWRARRLDVVARLASLAVTDLRAGGFAAASLLAASLVAAAGGRVEPDSLAPLADAVAPIEPAGLAAQAAALATGSPVAPGIAECVVSRGCDWAREAPGQDARREVLTPREGMARLARQPRQAPGI